MHAKAIFILTLLFLLPVAVHAQEPAKTQVEAAQAEQQAATYVPSNCAIDGTVSAIEKVEKSAWADGAPSSFSTVEVQISIKVASRAGYRGAGDDYCKIQATPQVMTYKLCSPTPVKPGDHIKAIEGRETGSAGALGCLFDVSVIALPQQ